MNAKKSILRPKSALPAALALFLGIACSSDIFDPPKAPEIQGLELDKYEADPGETVTATVAATDPKGLALRYEWTVSEGQLLPPLDRPQVKWKLPAVGGEYQITVKVSNEDKSASRSVNATVRSLTEPEVEILSPADGSHWVQHSTLSVSARARHDNGIARVDLFLNRSLKATLNGRTDGMYAFTCELEEPAGPARVVVEAVANVTGRAGSDSVAIVIDGVVIGKTARR